MCSSDLIEIVRAVRNTRAQYQVAPDRWVEARVHAGELTPAVSAYEGVITALARAKPVGFVADKRASSAKDAVVTVLREAEVVVPMASMIDVEAERKRLEKEVAEVAADVTRLEKRLGDGAFLTKAPPAVVTRERDRLAVRRDKLGRLKEQLTRFGV